METTDILKKVRKIEIKSRGLSRNIFSGHYHSAFKGRGMTFSEVREYQYGDDIRNIDWNVTARFNNPFVKIFEEEREMTVMLLIDVSGSNEFGTKIQFKEDMITEIAAVLAFSAIQNNDKVGVIFFSDQIEHFIPPKKGSKHILRIIRELISFRPKSQKTDIGLALKYFTNVIKKRCTAFLITDFVENNKTDRFETPLRIALKKHDLVGIRIYDEKERLLPKMGIIRMFDKESGQKITVNTSSKKFRKQQHNWWKKYNQQLEELFLKSGMDVVNIRTDQDYVKSLVRLFTMRESRF